RQLPGRDHAIIGAPAILAELRHLGIRRRSAGPLTWRIVNRWRVTHDCPILRGYHDDRVRRPPVTTHYALTAWLLSRFTSADLFAVVVSTPGFDPRGSFSATGAGSSNRAA